MCKKISKYKVSSKTYHYVELEKYPWTFKGHLRYKTIFCHRVALDVYILIFLFEEKMFRFRNI